MEQEKQEVPRIGGIQYPIEVSKIVWGDHNAIEKGWMCNVGDLVRVRPVNEKYGKKTYLGVYIGEVAQTIRASYNKETKELKIDYSMHNPAMFIPDLNEIIYGSGSWWGRITSKDQLKDITDEDINNIWYVKALKQIAELEKKHGAEDVNGEGGLTDASDV